MSERAGVHHEGPLALLREVNRQDAEDAKVREKTGENGVPKQS
jgi:hypothetical protein